MVSIIHSENPKEPDQRKSRLPKKIHRTKELTKDDPEDSLITNGDVQVTRSSSQARSRSKIRNAISGVFSHFRSKSRTSLDSRSSTPGLEAESPKYFKFFSKKHQKVEQNGGAINSDRRQVHWQRSVHNISCTDSDESVIETPRNSISVLNLNHVTMDRELNPTINPLSNGSSGSLDLMELDWKPAEEIIPNSPVPSYIHASCARYGYTRARSPIFSRAHLPPSKVEMRKQKFENGVQNGQNGVVSPLSASQTEKPMSPDNPIKDIISKFDSMKIISSNSPKPPVPPKPNRNGLTKPTPSVRKASNDEISIPKQNGVLTNDNQLNGVEKTESNGILTIAINSDLMEKSESKSIKKPEANGISKSEEYDFSLPYYPLPTTKTINSFRELASSVRSKLEKLAETAENVLEDPNLTLSEEASGIIRSSHGMTNLLLRKNMSKFSKLCDDAMNPNAEKMTYAEDLEGFWMLIDMELEGLRVEYNTIDQWSKNGWKVEEAVKKVEKKSAAVNGVNLAKTKQNGIATKSEGQEAKSEAAQKRRNDLLEFKRRAREKMEAEAAAKNHE